tara:strand:+ start:308 stop:1465 length:1158 start_codon:yes stop_codon:yes gene_type:complete
MAVYTGRIRQKDEKEKALKDLSKKSRKAAKGEAKRKGMSNLFGTVGGMGLGALTAGLTGVTGGLALPLIMGLSSSAAKGIADAGSKGKFGKAFKTPGQVGEITSDNKYGYGREEAKDIQEELQESRDATSFTPQSMLEDVALSYLSAGVGGELSNVGKNIAGGNFSKAITGVDDYSLAGTPISKALSNLKSNLGDVPFSNSPSQYSMRMNMEYGDKIPKYKKGGGIFGFGKKGKEPERDKALMALDAILSSAYEKKEGRHEFPMGRIQASNEIYPDNSNLVRTIAKYKTDDGDRYYPGEGKSRNNSLANSLALMDASERAYHSPADSITTDQLAKLRELGLFMQGGQVPKYEGGGEVTLYDYFAAQGKTMGGSNTMSIAQKLGRR